MTEALLGRVIWERLRLAPRGRSRDPGWEIEVMLGLVVCLGEAWPEIFFVVLVHDIWQYLCRALVF